MKVFWPLPVVGGLSVVSKSPAIRGPVDPQKTETLKFSSIEDYNTFQEKLSTQGWTLATKVGVSLGKLTMKLQGDYSEEEKEKHKKEMHKKVRTVIVTESLYVPMKCFQIPQLQMTLTDEAKADARRVTSATEATTFLEKYSSHVYAGLYHVGGVLFREVNVTSSHETNACLLMRRGLCKLEISGEVSYSSPFFDGKAEGTFSQFSDTESYEFANSSLQFETSKVTVRVWGATSVEAKDEFLKKLDADHAAWAFIDKDIDQLKDLVGIWELMAIDRDLKKPALEICKQWHTTSSGEVAELASSKTDEDKNRSKWLKSLLDRGKAFQDAIQKEINQSNSGTGDNKPK
ncbi:hypothetical protein SELMODRAFT_402708 [Selaginella moellendorffii]|uniref:MACPF domain-containing protein n=1 Tax=Selaginella moellendorffii TaxID=88036 RepID=D8QMT2_SELML|nr:hypothetical protein SELMODRAFT_402708 [Selaginella moellendorffii]